MLARTISSFRNRKFQHFKCSLFSKAVLTIFFVINYAGSSLMAQSITINVKNVPLESVFPVIEKQSGFYFTYTKEQLRGTKPITVDLKNASLKEVLDNCFKDQPVSYELLDKSIIIKAAKKQLASAVITPALITIKGSVIDNEDNMALLGATIAIKGMNKGAMAGSDGTFELRNLPPATIIVISYTGYAPQTFKAESWVQNTAVKLVRTERKLNEVSISTGYYKRPIENFTGAGTSVTGDQLRKINTLNVFDAMKIFDPSLRIPDNTVMGSDPNSMPKIEIRGTNNFPQTGTSAQVVPTTGGAVPSGADFTSSYINNPNEPLFIMDGFQVSLQQVYDLDINRIERFTILKDAAATAVYGSRAANGVIVIETKQPLPGKLRVSYSGNLQVTLPDLTSYNLLDATGKLQLEKNAGLYNSPNTALNLQLQEIYNKRLYGIKEGINTYWLSKPLQVGSGQHHTVALEGGDQSIRYALNLSYNNLKGVMIGSDRNTYSVDVNLSYHKKNLTFKNVTGFSFNNANNSPYGSFAQYAAAIPYYRTNDTTGHLLKVLDQVSYGSAGATFYNPMYNATINTKNYSLYTNIVNNSIIDWSLGRGFRLTGRFSITKQTDEADQFNPPDATQFIGQTNFALKGQFNKSWSSFTSFEGGVQLDYNRKIGKSQFFSSTGTSIAQQTSDATGISVTGFASNNMNLISLGNAYTANTVPSASENVVRRASFFSNFNYSYDNRYQADISVSTDGSSQFGSNNRFAPFWATGLAWNAHKEKIFSHLKNVITQLRFRASIGETGTQNFPPYLADQSFSYSTTQQYRGQLAANLLGYGNPNLQWQQTLHKNIGTDIVLFKSRLSAKADYYIDHTNNLIVDVTTVPSVGFGSYKDNLGSMQNTGLEITVNYFVIQNKRKSVYWSVFVNGLHNTNKILQISNALKQVNALNNTGTQTAPTLLYQEGKSVNSIWAVKSLGIDPSSGQELFQTANGGKTFTWNAADKVIVGDGIPKWTGNFGSNLIVKGFTFGLFFNYQYHGQLYNQTLANKVENVTMTLSSLNQNLDARVLTDRWQKPGDKAFFKGILNVDGTLNTTITNATSRFLMRDDFINCASSSFTYLLPATIQKKFRVQNARIGLLMNNIFRIGTVLAERSTNYPFAENVSFNISASF